MLNSLGQPIRYQVTARSVTANQSMQEIDLTEDVSVDPVYAQRRADSYALRLNQQQFLQSTDWVGVIVPITHPGA
jgi:uncharacterized protein with PhoU and TrkA domain